MNTLYFDQASTALAFSPQVSLGKNFGSVLGAEGEVIPPGIELVSETHFRLSFYAPSAQSVLLHSFGGDLPLERQPGGVWTLVQEIGPGGFRPLFFSVDGVRVLNPMAPIGFGASAPVNVADPPQRGVDFFHLKNCPHGSVSQEFYYAKTTGRHESCLVYTPPGYMAGGDEHYPVLYLQHGHGENEHCWVHQGKVNFIMDNLLAQGAAVPCIIVMNNGMVQQHTENGCVIRSELFLQLLVEDCIPHIEKHYRAKTGSLNRAMAGLSMGSLQTSATTLAHPGLFSWAGIFSGFLRPLEGLRYNEGYLRTLDDAALFNSSFRLFFRAMGTEDPFFPSFREDSALLEKKGLSPQDSPCHIARTYSGSHDWNVWRQCAHDFLQLIFQTG